MKYIQLPKTEYASPGYASGNGKKLNHMDKHKKLAGEVWDSILKPSKKKKISIRSTERIKTR